MDVVVDRVAGLDIGKATVTVCVRTLGPRGTRASETRAFSKMTRAVQEMDARLVENGVTLAAMESTATYWKPVFYCLEEHMDSWARIRAPTGPVFRRWTPSTTPSGSQIVGQNHGARVMPWRAKSPLQRQHGPPHRRCS
jgi:transposase